MLMAPSICATIGDSSRQRHALDICSEILPANWTGIQFFKNSDMRRENVFITIPFPAEYVVDDEKPRWQDSRTSKFVLSDFEACGSQEVKLIISATRKRTFLNYAP